ncbi:MAG: lysoplasmalogenase, partial [Clostridia bacterium]|nr:lysoplasmalogenase [Clostridia bacterium]
VIFAGFLPAYFGDYFLAKKEYPIDEKSDNFNFVCGVSFFGAAQALYLIGFTYAANWQLSPYLIPLCAYSLIPTLGGMAGGMLSVDKNKKFIMIVYGLLLSFTLYTASSRYYLFPSTSSLLAMIGAISFCLSDSVLGLYYFGNLKINKKWLNYPIMLLYFAAQILYALSFLYA